MQFSRLPIFGLLWLASFGATFAQSTSSVRADGTILLNDQPYFPFGYYHVSWVDNRKGQQLIDDLVDNADNGANFIHPNLDPVEASDRFLEEAAQRGVYVGVEMYWPQRAQIVNRMKNQSAILGWNVGDDVNFPGTNPRHPAQELKSRSDEIKSLDSKHITYASAIGAPVLEIEAYAKAQAVDVLGIQSYPVGNVSDNQVLEENISYYQHTYNSTKDYKNFAIVANLQTFAWSGQRYPDKKEVRNLLYGALIYGAKGVMAYTFYDGGGTLMSNQPALWNELGLLKEEVEVLAPVLMNGDHTVLDTGTKGVYAAQWTYEDDLYVALLNTSRSENQVVELNLGVSGSVEAIFDRGTPNMSFSDGRLSGNITAEEVYVYKVDTKSSVPPTPMAELTNGTYELHPASSSDQVVTRKGSSNGSNVALATDQDRANQRWQVTQLENGYYRLISPTTQQCLDVRKRGNTDGTNVQTWRLNPGGQSNQEWKITLEDEAQGYYSLSPRHTDEQGGSMRLDVSERNADNLHLWTNRGQANQRFVLERINTTAERRVGSQSKGGLLEEAAGDALTVYPNPAKEEVYVEGLSGGKGSVRIIDVLGREVMQQSLEGTQLRINISGLRPGMHYVVVTQAGQTISRPLMKE